MKKSILLPVVFGLGIIFSTPKTKAVNFKQIALGTGLSCGAVMALAGVVIGDNYFRKTKLTRELCDIETIAYRYVSCILTCGGTGLAYLCYKKLK